MLPQTKNQHLMETGFSPGFLYEVSLPLYRSNIWQDKSFLTRAARNNILKKQEKSKSY